MACFRTESVTCDFTSGGPLKIVFENRDIDVVVLDESTLQKELGVSQQNEDVTKNTIDETSARESDKNIAKDEMLVTCKKETLEDLPDQSKVI